MHDLIINRATAVLDGMRAAKTMYAMENPGGRRDLEPFVAIEWNEDQSFAPSLVPACQHDHDPAWMLRHILGRFNLYYSLLKKDVRRNAVTVMSETYVRSSPKDGYNEVERGELSRDFATNPATDVQEALMVMRAEDDTLGGCIIVSVSLPFHWEDGGGISFHDPIVYTEADGPMGGEMPDAIREFFQGVVPNFQEGH